MHKQSQKQHLQASMNSKTEFHNFAEDFDIELVDLFDQNQAVVDEGEVEFDFDDAYRFMDDDDIKTLFRFEMRRRKESREI